MGTRTYAIDVEATIGVIGGKRRSIILCNLRHGAICPSDLKRGITGISRKTLTQQLRELEEDSIIEREVYNQVSLKAEYYLGDCGQSLSAISDNLCNWGESHVAHSQRQGQETYLECED